MAQLLGKHSLKVKALAAVFGPQWAQTVLMWDGKPLTRAEIAERWTTFVSGERPDVRFSAQDVSDVVALARRMTCTQVSPELAAA